MDDPEGSAASAAYDYSERLPPMDPHIRNYAKSLASHKVALMPTFSIYYQRLPEHRNLWQEPAAVLLILRMFSAGQEDRRWLRYPLGVEQQASAGVDTTLDGRQPAQEVRPGGDAAVAHQPGMSAAHPHYLAASGAPAMGTMPGISMHTELEMLVRLGLSAREAVAAATNNYALQLGWTELGQIAPGRRASTFWCSMPIRRPTSGMRGESRH